MALASRSSSAPHPTPATQAIANAVARVARRDISEWPYPVVGDRKRPYKGPQAYPQSGKREGCRGAREEETLALPWRLRDVHSVERGHDLIGELRSVTWVHGRCADAHHHVLAVELLEVDVGVGASWDGHALLEQLLHFARLDVRGQPGAEVDRRRLAHRHDGGAQNDVVGDHDAVLAVRERDVEKAEGGDRTLHLARHPACVQAHPIA